VLNHAQIATLRKTRQTDIGSRLRKAMDLLDLTQLAVAAGAGFGQPYVSAVYRGAHNNITVDNARAFAEYLGCSIEDLFPAVVAPSSRQVARV
jgi:transcriptional regulator with XRE-family HTH domain